MRGYFISGEKIKEVKVNLRAMKAEIKRLEKKIENDTADAFDSTNLDVLLGQVSGIEYMLSRIMSED